MTQREDDEVEKKQGAPRPSITRSARMRTHTRRVLLVTPRIQGVVVACSPNMPYRQVFAYQSINSGRMTEISNNSCFGGMDVFFGTVYVPDCAEDAPPNGLSKKCHDTPTWDNAQPCNITAQCKTKVHLPQELFRWRVLHTPCTFPAPRLLQSC